MTVSIEMVAKHQAMGLISHCEYVTLSEDELRLFERCLMASANFWLGQHDGKLVCIWGIIPQTLLSDRAYLWLYTTPALRGHEFLFVRNSQRAVEDLLQLFPTIVGHAIVGQDQSIRWLRWLGATFGPPEGKLIPFVIRKRNG